jgi:hypothetical protein
MLSNNLDFKKLLLVHSRDRRHQVMEKELGNIPNLIVKMESRIKLEQDTIEAATQDLRSLETRNTTLEKEIDSITDQITRLKNKQLEVKKNEEYQALIKQVLSEQQIEDNRKLRLEMARGWSVIMWLLIKEGIQIFRYWS